MGLFKEIVRTAARASVAGAAIYADFVCIANATVSLRAPDDPRVDVREAVLADALGGQA
jgi:hypothetical protein